MTDDLKPTMGKNSGPASTTTTEPATWEEIARHLWDLLDDIDTAGDMFKPELEPFERYVLEKTRERFKHATSDGYEVTFNIRADPQPPVKGLKGKSVTPAQAAIPRKEALDAIFNLRRVEEKMVGIVASAYYAGYAEALKYCHTAVAALEAISEGE